jgi:peptidoglycan/LPS O-acetylase OafA/YrhL
MKHPEILSPTQRVYLDLVRASAAMMVLFGHAAHYFWPASFMAKGWLQGLGVYIFFLISGFLISFSVFVRHGDERYGFREYFIDRFCRIYSGFLPALLFVLLVDAADHLSPRYEWGRDYNPQTWLGNLVMLQDFPLFQVLRRLGVPDSPWFIAPFGSARPFWTISIEWWIYMLFGGVVLIWLRRPRGLGALGLLALAAVAIEPAYHFVGGFDQCLTILWIVGMGASFFLIQLRRQAAGQSGENRRLLRISLLVAAGSAIAIFARLFANRSGTDELQFGLFLASLVFAVLFALGFARLRVPEIAARLIGFLAGYSYSLYLLHHTLLDYLAIQFPGRSGAIAFWLAIAAANLLSIVFWYLFERHHRRMASALKQYFARPRSGLVPEARARGVR